MIRYLVIVIGVMFLSGCSTFEFGAGKIETDAGTVEDVKVKIEAKEAPKK